MPAHVGRLRHDCHVAQGTLDAGLLAHAPAQRRPEGVGECRPAGGDPHAAGRALTGPHALHCVAPHRADHRAHEIHHVVEHVAVQHPVARVIGDELDFAHLRHAHQHGVAGNPGRGLNPAPFRARDPERQAVKVHRVVIDAR